MGGGRHDLEALASSRPKGYATITKWENGRDDGEDARHMERTNWLPELVENK